MSSKERCFRQSAFAYEQATGQDLGLTHHQVWRRMIDGSWQKASNWHSALNSIGLGRADQFRVPDLTIDGNTVVDLKFTRSNGTVDDWSTRPGQSGTFQRDDYVDINDQHSPDFDNPDPKLDPTTCRCDDRGGDGIGVEVDLVDPVLGMYTLPSGQRIQMGRIGTGALRPLGGLGGIRFPVPTSTRTEKSDIVPAKLDAEKLLELELKRWNWGGDGTPDVGLIAEEVKDLIPELYYEDADHIGIRAAKLPFFLLDLIQKQDARIKALEARLETRSDDQTEGNDP